MCPLPKLANRSKISRRASMLEALLFQLRTDNSRLAAKPNFGLLIEGINVRILIISFINQNPRLIKFQLLTLLTRFTGLNLSTAWYRIKHEGRETRETLAIVPLMLPRFLPPN
jgi:hypothetical protein